MTRKPVLHKPAALYALTLLTLLCVVGISTAEADESILADANLFRSTYFEDMLDGDVIMTGNDRAGLHLSTRSQTDAARYVSQHTGSANRDSGVHMSWKIAW